MKNWNNITLRDYQALVNVQSSGMDEMDKQTELISILSGKTNKQLEEMPLADYNRLAVRMKEVLAVDKVPGEVKELINGLYICYDVSKVTKGQWNTLMHFMQGNPILNAHLILASVAQPSRKRWWGAKVMPHQPEHHADYAELLLEAPVKDVYHSCLFFCKVFKNSLAASLDYLEAQARAKGENIQTEVRAAIQASISVMDGFIAQNS